MLGRQSSQRELFRPDNLYEDHVGADTFYAVLSRLRGDLFRDGDFAELYRLDTGRPSVPPSLLCVALLLQAHEGVSDQEAIDRSAFDLRWKVALGLKLEDKLCAKSTLQHFRAKLILHERYQTIFDKSVAACSKSGLLKKNRRVSLALDTTPVFGRGAVRDTFNLVSDQIRRLIGEIAALKELELEEVITGERLDRHFGSSFKGEAPIDWQSEQEKRALIGELVDDARRTQVLAAKALRGYRGNSEKTKRLREAQQLLRELLLQDVDEDPDDGGPPRIRKDKTGDRIVSTTDPDMRRGYKSKTQSFDGYKAAVAVDTRTGVILSTDVQPGNVHDSTEAASLVKSAQQRSPASVKEVLGDTAYGSLKTREELGALGVEVVAKVSGGRKKFFALSDFKIQQSRGIAVCPAGKRSTRRDKVHADRGGVRYVFARTDCADCPLRSQCTRSRHGPRTLTVGPQTPELERLRRQQKTKRFQKRYRRRVAAEHAFARLIRYGIRQARYFGQRKVACQIAMAAAVANLKLAAAVA